MQIETFEKLKNICKEKNLEVFEPAQQLEAQLLDISTDEFRNKVSITLDAMKEAIETGLKSKGETNGKMGGLDCFKQQEYYKNHPSVFGKLFEKAVCYALATSEENARMGKIAACPTAGACGIVPAVLVSIFEEFNIEKEKQINALIIAGITGSIIASKVSPAGAVAGCQAECGTAGAMAAAAAAYLFNGNIDKIFNAAALSLKNVLGLTCDPVRGYVEVPCIKRNPIIAIHALTSAEIAMSGVESVIPLDEVVDAMQETGALMAQGLKESSLNGLAKTKTAIMMKKACFTKKYYSEFKE